MNRLNTYKELIEGNLSSFFDTKSNLLKESMLYSLNAGGKRLRPILLLEFCNIFSGEYKNALPYAVAIEMIHTYSLIHDDLPCMDNDDLRRGKPTNHIKFSENVALLAGDSLLNTAFEIISNPIYAKNFQTEQVLRVVQEFSSCSGINGMIYGQMLDIRGEVSNISELETLHLNKTGKLLKASCVSGAILGGANDEEVQKVANFALNLGLAFQIKDDILDKYGNEEQLGKPIGSDEENDKKTFLSYKTKEECEFLVEKYTKIAIENIKDFKGSDFLIDLSNNLVKRNF